MSQEEGPATRGKWYLKPLNTPTKAVMMDLHYLLGEPMIMPTSIAPEEDEIYLASAEIVKRALKSQVRLKYRAYWQSGQASVLRHRSQFSRNK